MSSVWSEVCSILGILRIKTTSFHPQSNGMIEGFHRSLKSSLRARLASSDWVSHLPLVVLGLRSSPKDDSGFSPAEAVYSSNLSLPGEFIEHSEIPPQSFLRKVDLAIRCFYRPPRHHLTPQPQLQWRQSTCLFETTHLNLRYLRSTEYPNWFPGAPRIFLCFKLEIKQILYPWTD